MIFSFGFPFWPLMVSISNKRGLINFNEIQLLLYSVTMTSSSLVVGFFFGKQEEPQVQDTKDFKETLLGKQILIIVATSQPQIRRTQAN